MFSKEYKYVNYMDKGISLVKILDHKVELTSTVIKVSFPPIAINFSFLFEIPILNKNFQVKQIIQIHCRTQKINDFIIIKITSTGVFSFEEILPDTYCLLCNVAYLKMK